MTRQNAEHLYLRLSLLLSLCRRRLRGLGAVDGRTLLVHFLGCTVDVTTLDNKQTTDGESSSTSGDSEPPPMGGRNLMSCR